MAGQSEPEYDGVTPEEMVRWDDDKVRDFRKKLAPFFAVSAVVTVLAVFGVLNLMGIVGIWSVYLAYQYAKLWTDGFDWRDVFKQPRDRLFFDVVAESIDDFRALFDKKKRSEVLERDRMRARTSNRRPVRRDVGAGRWRRPRFRRRTSRGYRRRTRRRFGTQRGIATTSCG